MKEEVDTQAASLRRMRHAFDLSPAFRVLLAPDGTVLEANQAARELSGAALEEVTQRPFWQTPWWPGLEDSAARLRRCVEAAVAGENVREQYEFRDSTGRFRQVEFSLTGLRNGDGRLETLLAEANTTADNASHEALARSEKMFREAMNASVIGMALVAPDGRWLKVNAALCRLLGYDESELLSGDFHSVTYPDDDARGREQAARLLGGEADHVHFEKRYITKAGKVIWVSISASLVREGNAPAFFISQIQDIQARKSSEHRLVALREELEQRVAERTRDLVVANANLQRERRRMMILSGIAEQSNLASSVEEVLRFAVEALCDMAQWQAGHVWLIEDNDQVLRSTGAWVLSDPERFAPLRRLGEMRHPPGVGMVGRVMATGQPEWSDDIRRSREPVGMAAMLACDIRFVLTLPIPVHGQVVAALQFFSTEIGGAYSDEMHQFIDQVTNLLHIVAEHKYEEKELRHLALVVQHTTSSVVLTDAAGLIRWVNPAFNRLTGYQLDEVIGMSPGKVLQGPETDPGTVDRLREAIRAGREVQVEILNYSKTGQKYWVDVSIGYFRDKAGKIVNVIGIQQDITSRRRAEDALRQKDRELDALVGNLADAVINTDRNGIIRSANAATERMFGYRADELVGRSFFDLVPMPDDAHPIAAHLEAHSDSGAVFGREAEGVCRDGRRVPVEVTASSYRVGDEVFFTGILHDISERRQVIAELTQAKEDAEAANRAKSAFLAAMSHEIRTPLNGVVGMIDLLGYSPLNAGQQEMTQTIRESAFALLGVIDDILDFSKIEAGHLNFESLPVSVEEIVEGVAETLAPIAEKKQTELLMFVDPSIPARVVSDPVRLRQILMNLAGNAIKFSGVEAGRSGRVWLSAELVGMFGGRARIRFDIGDNGIGISPSAQAALFKPFSQAESSTTRRFGGTGLGLSICRRLTSMMNGTLTVDSVEGEGSVFSATLDFELAPPAAETRIPAGLNRLEVLIPGDHTLLKHVAAYLEAAGCRVRQGAAAHARLTATAVDSRAPVAMLLEAAYGSDACQEFRRALDHTPHAGEWPRVEIGLGRRRGPRQTGRSVAIDGPLLRRSALLDAVAAAIGGDLPQATKGPSLVKVVSSDFQMPPFETALAAGRVVLVAEDNAINRAVILRQLQLLGYVAEAVNNGREALQRWQTDKHRVILADFHMPELDGIGLTQAIREAEAGSGGHTVIIAFTANAMKGESERMLAAGMDDFISKPVVLARLAETLSRWLPSEMEPSGEPPDRLDGGGEQVFISTALSDLVGDDPEAVAGFLDAFIDQTRGDIAKLQAAFEAHAAAPVGAMAHKMKSSARTVGAFRLATLCDTLETAGKAADWSSIEALMAALPEQFAAVFAALGNKGKS